MHGVLVRRGFYVPESTGVFVHERIQGHQFFRFDIHFYQKVPAVEVVCQ